MLVKAQSGKLEISTDDGVSWTQVAPSEADVDFEQVFTRHIVTIEIQPDDHERIWKKLEWLLWGDRLN
jgi:hypothetical protein